MSPTGFRADLHCHSTCSDGTLTPVELVRLAVDRGLSALSITDHDTVEAYRTAIPEAAKVGIELLVGAEFSAVFEKQTVHVLGYGFSEESDVIKAFCLRHHERRKERNRGMLKKLSQHGLKVDEGDLPSSGTVGRPHIGMALIAKGYVKDLREAFRKYIGDGKRCHVRGDGIGVEETIQVIHEAGGLAILAHPHLSFDERLLSCPFDGIECYYARFMLAQNQKWLKITEERDWLITGGSDCHGDVKPTLYLGSSWINEEHFRKLQARLK